VINRLRRICFSKCSFSRMRRVSERALDAVLLPDEDAIDFWESICSEKPTEETIVTYYLRTGTLVKYLFS
jgi:hypothetical protein